MTKRKRLYFKHTKFGPLPTILASCALLLGGVSASSQAQSSATPSPDATPDTPKIVSEQTSEWDWYPLEQLSTEDKTKVPASCSGLYIDPQARLATTGEASSTTQALHIEADSSQVTDGEYARLEGRVILTQGAQEIRADTLEFSRAQNLAKMQGNVSIRQPGMLVRSEKASANTLDQSAQFEQSKIVLHASRMRGTAGAVSKNGNGAITLINGSITSCEPGRKGWSLNGEKLYLDAEKGQGYGKNVTLRVADVPIFYLPYITFPVGDERQSGFLFPSISTSDEGVDLALPYYWNLAPNYDATITPRLITGRGAMLEAELRHLNHYFASDVSIGFLPNDKGGSDQDWDSLIEQGEVDASQAFPYKGQDRWLAQFKQQGRGMHRSNRWNSEINFTKVSDIDYLRDLSTSSLVVNSTSQLEQSLALSYQLPNWQFRAAAQNYQVLLADVDAPYRITPRLQATGFYPLAMINIQLDNQYTQFDHANEQRIDGSNIITGARFNSDYRINTRWQKSWGFIEPEVGYKALYYQLDDPNTTIVDNPNFTRSFGLGAGQASLDMGMVFEQPQGRFLQTLEPRAFYLYRQYADHRQFYNIDGSGQALNFDTSLRTFSYNQLYRDSRFSGYDRIDDANQLTIGLTSRWYSNDSNRELLSLSLGQITHFRDRRVGLNNENQRSKSSSELAFSADMAAGPNAHTYISGVYDSDTEILHRASAGLNYRSSDNYVLANMQYSYINANPEVAESENIQQLDSSLITPLNPQWNIFARVNYDFENEQELESFFGFEYSACCYSVRLLARRWLDSNIANLTDNEDAVFDQGIFFELHLKGLGGSGASVESILDDSIVGYRERQNDLTR